MISLRELQRRCITSLSSQTCQTTTSCSSVMCRKRYWIGSAPATPSLPLTPGVGALAAVVTWRPGLPSEYLCLHHVHSSYLPPTIRVFPLIIFHPPLSRLPSRCLPYYHLPPVTCDLPQPAFRPPFLLPPHVSVPLSGAYSSSCAARRYWQWVFAASQTSKYLFPTPLP